VVDQVWAVKDSLSLCVEWLNSSFRQSVQGYEAEVLDAFDKPGAIPFTTIHYKMGCDM
jgi:hypothetical protein